MISSIISLAFFAQTIRITVPYALASLGGVYSERGGVTNIALEGIMLNGAFGATVGTYYTGNPLIGITCGITSGLLTALIHGVVSINIKADQIILGHSHQSLRRGNHEVHSRNTIPTRATQTESPGSHIGNCLSSKVHLKLTNCSGTLWCCSRFSLSSQATS